MANDHLAQAALDAALAPVRNALRDAVADLGIGPPVVAPSDPGAGDATTLATIEVTEPDGTITSVPNITAFSYSSDVQQIADPFAVTVPDPRRVYMSKLTEGSRVTFSLQSPLVAGGAKTKKITGLVVRRELTVNESGGTVIQIQGADLGWHLANNDGPFWFGLQDVTFGDLCTAFIHPDRILSASAAVDTGDPGWGFGDEVLFSNVENTIAKQKLDQRRRGVILAQQASVIDPLARIQVEPGEKLFDLLSLYAKRILCFVGVTADGSLVVFRPSVRDPDYHFYCYPTDDSRADRLNNVRAEGIRVVNDISERWTDITCVGELPLPDLQDGHIAQDNVNANKFYGRYLAPDETAGIPKLPFMHRLVFTDGEAMYRSFANDRARWKAFMGLFNSHVVTFTVRHHHQNGTWFESDTTCTLDFPVAGVSGTYYISAVRCDRDDQGDRTFITAHKNGLLGA
jgi:hypothetical protein